MTMKDWFLTEKDGATIVLRNIGWLGQSGKFYALGDDLHVERGGFSTLWVQIDSIEPDLGADDGNS